MDTLPQIKPNLEAKTFLAKSIGLPFNLVDSISRDANKCSKLNLALKVARAKVSIVTKIMNKGLSVVR